MSAFSEERDFNFFTLSLTLMSGSLQSLLGIILLDYDVLKGHSLGAFAAVADGIRIIFGMLLLTVVIAGAISIFRR